MWSVYSGGGSLSLVPPKEFKPAVGAQWVDGVGA